MKITSCRLIFKCQPRTKDWICTKVDWRSVKPAYCKTSC